jgi:hypothetical protein
MKYEEFVHLLRFECPHCGSPIVAAITSEYSNLEETDAREVGLRCNCHWTGESLGLTSRHHLVVQREQGRIISASFNSDSTENLASLKI